MGLRPAIRVIDGDVKEESFPRRRNDAGSELPKWLSQFDVSQSVRGGF